MANRLPEDKRVDDQQITAVLAIRDQEGYRNRAYQPGRITLEAREEIARVFFRNGEAVPETQVIANMEKLRLSFRSRAEQIAASVGGKTFRGCTKNEFRLTPRTTEKVMQEVLTADVDKQSSRKPADGEAQGRNIEKIIIDPRCITDTLLKNLGLEEYIPEKSVKGTERIRQYAQLIPLIKASLQTLEPLRTPPGNGRKHFRLFRIGNGRHEGELLIAQEIVGKDILARADLHDALLRIRHIKTQYDEERRHLNQLFESFRQIDRELENWSKKPKNAKRRQILKTDLQARIEAHVIMLQFVSDAFKTRVREMAENGLCMLKDNNPPAARAAMYLRGRNGMLATIQRRIDNTIGIQREIADDGLTLRWQWDTSNIDVVKFYELVERQHVSFRILDPKQSVPRGIRGKIKENLQRYQEQFGKISLEPLRSFAHALIKSIDHCIALLDDSKLDSAQMQEMTQARKELQKRFVYIYLFAKLQKAHLLLMEFYEMVTFHRPRVERNFDIQLFHWKLNQISEIGIRRSVAPQIQTPEFSPVWGDIRALTHKLRRHLGQLKKAVDVGDKEEEGEIAARMREIIRELDLPQKTLDLAAAITAAVTPETTEDT